MAREPKPATGFEKKIPPVVDGQHAPVLYFEEAPNFGHTNGIVNITLAAYRSLPDAEGDITTDLIVTAHLRCNIPAALALRKAIDDALLVATPAKGHAN